MAEKVERLPNIPVTEKEVNDLAKQVEKEVEKNGNTKK